MIDKSPDGFDLTRARTFANVTISLAPTMSMETRSSWSDSQEELSLLAQ